MSQPHAPIHTYVHACVYSPYEWIPMPMFIFPCALPSCSHENTLKNECFFLLIKLSYLSYCHVTTLAPCPPPHPSFPHHACLLHLWSPTFLHLFPLSYLTCLFWRRTFGMRPFCFRKLVGHVSIFHRFPRSRYPLYIDFQPPRGACKGTA